MQKFAQPVLQIKKLSPTAIIPSKGSQRAAGYDVCADGQYTVPKHGKVLVQTGLSMAIPTGNYGRVAPRSGLALQNFIDVGAGVIDEDYRGELGVLLFNHSEIDFPIKHGDRIAQLIIEKITYTQIEEVQELSETDRGAGGFGSTGVSNPIKNSFKREAFQENQDMENNLRIKSEKCTSAERAIVMLINWQKDHVVEEETAQKMRKNIHSGDQSTIDEMVQLGQTKDLDQFESFIRKFKNL